MKLLNTVVKNAQQFTGREIFIYKLCVLSAAALVTLVVPQITQGPLWLYIVLAIVFYGMALHTCIKKEGKYIKKVLLGNMGVQFFKKHNAIDFAVFELTVFLVGLLLIVLFPAVLTIHVGWYIGICAGTTGYLIATILRK